MRVHELPGVPPGEPIDVDAAKRAMKVAMHRSLAVTLLLTVAGCATSGSASDDTAATATSAVGTDAREQAAAAHVKARLDALPACAAGTDVGQLSVAASSCTKKFCRAACCNGCSWAPTFETKGGPQPVTVAQVQALLELPPGALDCEVAAWNAALAGASVAFDGGGCAVR